MSLPHPTTPAPAAHPLAASLGRLSLFQSLADDELTPLALRCRRRAYRAGEALFREGDPGQTLYLIVAGHVNIERATEDGGMVHIARRGPGEHFGEMSLFDDLPRSADAVTDTPCELLMLDRHDVVRFLEEHPAAAWRIIRGLSIRLREATDRILGDGTRDALGRLAAALLDAAPTAARDADGHPILPDLTDTRLAQRIGSTRETVNRRLSSLRRLGVVRRDGARLILLDLPRLQTLRDRA